MTTLQVIFIVPIVFYSFYSSVYNFGPKHRRRTFSEIYQDPVPPEESFFWNERGQLYTRDNPNIVPRKVMRSKRFLSKQDRRDQAKHRRLKFKDQRRIIPQTTQYKCPTSEITPMTERHGIYSMYTNPHAGIIGYDNAYVSNGMTKTLYFAINSFSYPYWVYLEPPKKPPDGIITHVIMSSVITGIFMVIVSKAYMRLRCRIILRNTRRRLRKMVTPKSIGLCKRIYSACVPSQFTPSIRLHSLVHLLRVISGDKSHFSWHEMVDYFMREDPLDSKKQSTSYSDEDGFFYFDTDDGHDLFFDSFNSYDEIEHDDTTECIFNSSQHPARSIISAFATGEEDEYGDNTTASFDTDSSFWVCDNSATGHICNDKSLFHGPMIPSEYNVGSATGTSEPNLMGTVMLWVTDNEGVEHTFALKDCVYLPQSPVNLLSTRRLAEQFPEGHGGVDRRGTGITSVFEDHTLFWHGNQYRKTFHTANSGLPECLFNTGYSRLKTYTSQVTRHYNDSVSWAFTSESKEKSYVEGDKIDLCPEDTVSFLKGMKLLYNDGSGTKELVTFLAVDFIDDMQLKCQIQRSDGSQALVYPEMLNFIENPDIASVPQTSDDYCRECHNVQPEDLKHILDPKPLSPLQEEMMSYHNRLHHLPFPKLIALAERGDIPKRLADLKGRTPICVACVFGTAHKRPWRTKSKKRKSIRKESDNAPGKKTSVDQIVSAQPGLIPQMSGFLTNLRINGATVFVDHYSDHVYVYLMRDLTLDETLLTKAAYERFLHSIGASAHAYHADNGRFADKGFQDDCKQNNQTITFCGVGAHHQNGIAERKIKDITLGGRTLLLHAKRMLPEYISTILWPFAIKCYEDRMNNLVHRADGRTPYQTLARLDATAINVANFHVFGCPCYVLDHRLQSGQSMVPKWEPRARMGIYVGRSPAHASNVGLILNPRTGHVSPQFHVVYDDNFTTVPYLRTGTVPPHWADLVRESSDLRQVDSQKGTWQSLSIDDPISEGDFSSDPDVVLTELQSSPANINHIQDAEQSTRSFDREGESDASNRTVTFQEESQPQTEFTNLENNTVQQRQMPVPIDLNTSGLRRSSRLAELKKREAEHPSNDSYTNPNRRAYTAKTTNTKRACLALFSLFCALGTETLWSFTLQASKNTAHASFSATSSLLSNAVDSYHRANVLYDNTINCFSTMTVAAEASNEVFTYRDALKQPDRVEFIKAMVKEIEDHEKRGHWEIVEKSTIPDGTKTIMSIWSFKRKRFPDGSLNKHKARLCAHGGMQTWGQNYWETYAPVVNWTSVRMLLAVANIHNLPSKSIDFVLAFPQAKLEVPVYMQLPVGFVYDEEQRGKYVLKLVSNLYGLKQGSYNWFKKLEAGLIDRSFCTQPSRPLCILWRRMYCSHVR